MTPHTSAPFTAIPVPCTPLHPETFPTFKLSLQPKCLLLLLSQVAFGSPGLQLGFCILSLQFVNLLQQSVDFVTSFSDIVRELLGRFLPSGQLCLEIFDCAIDIAGRFQRGGVFLVLSFELVLKLQMYI